MDWARGEAPAPLIRSTGSSSCVPDRTGLPPLGAYAQLVTNGGHAAGRLHRGVARLQASVPALSGGPGLSRRVSRRADGGGAGGYPPAGGRRRAAHHVRRSRFLQRPGPRHGDRGGAASRMARPDLRRHHQDRASAEASRPAAGAARHRLPVRASARSSRSTTRCWNGSQKGHTRADFVEALAADAGGGPAAVADLHPVHAVDHAARAIAISCASWWNWTWRSRWRRFSWRSGC